MGRFESNALVLLHRRLPEISMIREDSPVLLPRSSLQSIRGFKKLRSDSFRKGCAPRPILLFQKMRGWLRRIGGVVAGWFFSKDATSFNVVQMMVATLVLAAFVALLVFWQSLFEYGRSLWKT